MEWHYNILQNTQISCPAQDHTSTYRHHKEQPLCSTIQNRSAHEPHLQQGSTNPEYKSPQQDLTEIRINNTQEYRLRDSRYGFSNNQGSFA